MSVTSVTHSEMEKAIAKIEETKERIRSAVATAADGTHSVVGVAMVGEFANGCSAASTRAQECSDQLCREADDFIAALQRTRGVTDGTDAEQAALAKAIDPTASAMPNFSRLV